jgi:hypothetical protein
MRAFKAVRFPFGLFLAASPDRRLPCAAAVAHAANRAAPARPGFLIVLLRALSAWGA